MQITENAAIRYGDSIIIGKNNGYFIIDKSGNIIEENNHIHLAGFVVLTLFWEENSASQIGRRRSS